MAIVIGLTGGTGCGKSTAAAYLRTKGAYIIDADEIARSITAPGGSATAAIAAAFPEAMQPDGGLDRKKLGAIVFADPQARSVLNQITHPAIMQEIGRLLQQTKASVVVIDAPLLLECGLDRLCTACIGVLADPARRLARIMERDRLTEAEARRRMDAQPDDRYYRDRCRFIIENNDRPADVERRLDIILKELTP